MSQKEEWVPWDDTKIAPPVRRRAAHAMTRKLKRLPWVFCAHCGIMNLKNDATRSALRKPCEVWE